MSRTLRILPLVGVAVGGLIAVKAMAGVSALPDLLSATSASATEAPAKGRPGKPLNIAAVQTPLQSAKAPPPRPAPVCAPSLSELAKEASLSPAELTTLQSLQARRGQLDQRERAVDTQRQLLAAAELKLDAKLRALNALRDQLKGVLAQADQQKQAEVDRLVKVYEKMKPRDAGAVMAQLDDRVRLPVASKMREASLAAILSQMGTAQATALTEALARRYAPNEKLVQAAAQSAAASPAVAPAPVVDPLADPAVDPADDTVVKPKPKAKPAAKPHRAAPRPKAVGPKAVARKASPPALKVAAKAAAPAPAPVAAAAPPTPEPVKTAAATPAAQPSQVAASGDTRAR